MKTDLLTLMRQEYAKRHPDRDTRMMPVDDTLLALVAALETALSPLVARRTVSPGEMHRFVRHNPKDPE